MPNTRESHTNYHNYGRFNVKFGMEHNNEMVDKCGRYVTNANDQVTNKT